MVDMNNDMLQRIATFSQRQEDRRRDECDKCPKKLNYECNYNMRIFGRCPDRLYEVGQ